MTRTKKRKSEMFAAFLKKSIQSSLGMFDATEDLSAGELTEAEIEFVRFKLEGPRKRPKLKVVRS